MYLVIWSIPFFTGDDCAIQYAVIIISTICIPNDKRLQKPSYQPCKIFIGWWFVNTKAKTKVSSASIYFDNSTGGDFFGAGPSYNAPCSQDFVWGTADWTIEMWVYNDIAQTSNRSLMQCSTVADQGGIQLEWHSATTTLRFYDYTLESSWDEYARSSSSTPVDAWFHMAMVRESGVFTMYIDGTAQTAVAASSSNAMGSPTNPQFGLHRSDTGRYMKDSYLDMVRISNTARYTGNFTSPTTAIS